ncbi:DUF2087 domain-containing protein [Oscillospiraceae bacterium LTW-04]|nr:DUF2087 domain-containing protein [Oscillospiraceae bacterium MB24-C1]
MQQNTDIKRFLDASGRIIQLPKRAVPRAAVLSYLAEKFEAGSTYTEKSVNAICTQWHTFNDYFILRRELIDSGLLCRKPDGSSYWKPGEIRIALNAER